MNYDTIYVTRKHGGVTYSYGVPSLVRRLVVRLLFLVPVWMVLLTIILVKAALCS